MSSSAEAGAESASAGHGQRLVLALAAVYLVWGSTYYAIRLALVGVTPYYLAGTRYVVAGGILLVYLRVRGAAMPTARQWLLATPIGALLFVCGNGFVAVAEVKLGSGVAAMVVATMPLWMAMLAARFGEPPRAREWLGMAIGLAAVGLLCSGGDLRAEPVAALALVLAPIAWAVGSMMGRRLPMPQGLAGPAIQMVTGGVLALVVAAVIEPAPHLPGPRALLALIYLVVAGSLVGFSAYAWLLRHARPALATSYAYVNPPIAVLIGAALGGEAITWQVLVAGPLVVIAVALVVLRPRRS